MILDLLGVNTKKNPPLETVLKLLGRYLDIKSLVPAGDGLKIEKTASGFVCSSCTPSVSVTAKFYLHELMGNICSCGWEMVSDTVIEEGVVVGKSVRANNYVLGYWLMQSLATMFAVAAKTKTSGLKTSLPSSPEKFLEGMALLVRHTVKDKGIAKTKWADTILDTIGVLYDSFRDVFNDDPVFLQNALAKLGQLDTSPEREFSNVVRSVEDMMKTIATKSFSPSYSFEKPARDLDEGVDPERIKEETYAAVASATGQKSLNAALEGRVDSLLADFTESLNFLVETERKRLNGSQARFLVAVPARSLKDGAWVVLDHEEWIPVFNINRKAFRDPFEPKDHHVLLVSEVALRRFGWSERDNHQVPEGFKLTDEFAEIFTSLYQPAVNSNPFAAIFPGAVFLPSAPPGSPKVLLPGGVPFPLPPAAPVSKFSTVKETFEAVETLI